MDTIKHASHSMSDTLHHAADSVSDTLKGASPMKAWRTQGSHRNVRDDQDNTYANAQAQHARTAIRMFAQSKSKSTAWAKSTRSIFGMSHSASSGTATTTTTTTTTTRSEEHTS